MPMLMFPVWDLLHNTDAGQAYTLYSLIQCVIDKAATSDVHDAHASAAQFSTGRTYVQSLFGILFLVNGRTAVISCWGFPTGR